LSLRLFLDANVLFTAAYSPDGLSALLFELSRRELLVLLTSDHAVEEARVNLELKHPTAVKELDRLFLLLQIVETPATHPVALKLPEDDLAIFGAALGCAATHLITGDKKDFGRYFNKPDETAGIRIQSVRQFFNDRFGD
jgi:uncharacterized protein